MAVVSREEARERIAHFFHNVISPWAAPGHSIDRDNCWTCDSAAYAVVTPPKAQKAQLD